MDERTRRMIEAYIPSPPDETLEEGEYYYLQNSRVIRVRPLDVLPLHDGTEYGIYQQQGNRLVKIDAGYGDPFRGVRMSYLYDNKQDCRDCTHSMCDRWEELRRIQRDEAGTDAGGKE